MSSQMQTKLEDLLLKIEGITVELASREGKLKKIARLLENEFDNFNWVGFYLVDPKSKKKLILGPYIGAPTDHTEIEYGQGICGQAAESKETFVVQDVSKESNYLACSVDVKAEIVVPLIKDDGTFVGELDIDSHQKNSITTEQRNFLEKVCEILSKLF